MGEAKPQDLFQANLRPENSLQTIQSAFPQFIQEFELTCCVHQMLCAPDVGWTSILPCTDPSSLGWPPAGPLPTETFISTFSFQIQIQGLIFSTERRRCSAVAVTPVLSQGVSRLDHLPTHITFKARVVQVKALYMAGYVSLALGNLSTNSAVPRLLLILPHHGADLGFKCRHQF